MQRAQRRHLAAVIEEVHVWIGAAAEARHHAAHMPLTGAIGLDAGETLLVTPIEQAAASGDLDEAVRLTHTAWFPGRKTLDPARAAADRLATFHHAYASSSSNHRLTAMRDGLVARALEERDRLRALLRELDRSSSLAQQLLHDGAHLPMTRSGATSDEESMAAEALVRVVDGHRVAAGALLDASACIDQACAAAHNAARVLHEVHSEATKDGLFDLIGASAGRVARKLAAEREQLPVTLTHLEGWRAEARQLLADAKHLPLTRTGALSEVEAGLIGQMVAVYDANIRVARALQPSQCDTGTCAELHAPVEKLCSYHSSAVTNGHARIIHEVAKRLAAQAARERDQLRDLLRELDVWSQASAQGLHDAAHMPLTQSGVLSDRESAGMRTVTQLVGSHGEHARSLVDPATCATDSCNGRHNSATLLARYHADATKLGDDVALVGAAERVASQLHHEQQLLAGLFERAATWSDRVDAIRQTRLDALQFIESRVRQLQKSSTAFSLGTNRLRLLPLSEEDGQLVARLGLLRDSPLRGAEQEFLNQTVATAKEVLSTRGAFTSRWKCRSGGRCERAHELIPDVHTRANAVEQELDRLAVDIGHLPKDFDLLLDPSLGLMAWLSNDFCHPELLLSPTIERARGHLPAIVDAASTAKQAAGRAYAAADEVRGAEVARALKAMDLEALKKAAPEARIRVAPLQTYDLHNVWDVLQFQQKYLLDSLSGLGESSARTITQATLRLLEAVRDETPVRIDVKRKTKRTARLLDSLRAWDGARRFEPTQDEVALARALITVLEKHGHVEGVLAVTGGPAAEPPSLMADLLTAALDRISPPVEDVDIWTDFLSRPADYFGMLTELGFMTEDEKKMHGDLPDEIVEAVRAKELRRDHLTASLRTYQSFGARFALVQEKVVIGDEMGLGKTVEALAVLAHLRASGDSHFLVVCPAAVVSNWIRETAKHTQLRASRLHGPVWERNHAAKAWLRQGGVAVTTYDLLPWAEEYLDDVEVGCAVFDEAHYIKNPLAKRSLAAQEVIDSTRYAILMTGTPLENRVQEFRNLIAYLRPDLANSAPEYLPSKFRKHMAPAYLRRNQEDVLTELPEVVEVDEWMGMSAADDRSYRHAVQAGQFMLMRRAALMSEDSMKVARLIEIVEEAEANDRRVIVFSYFRDVLERLAGLLPGRVFGPLTGSIPAVDRQRLVDRYSAAPGGAVLISQITAGGVGLNIQSASVVVICEPQLKPTMEAQAIARAHRMGQTNTVQVHRLLTEGSVDERIREILEEKRQLFDEFARESVITAQAPDSVDVSDAELARIVIAAERERLFGQAEELSEEDQ